MHNKRIHTLSLYFSLATDALFPLSWNWVSQTLQTRRADYNLMHIFLYKYLLKPALLFIIW